MNSKHAETLVTFMRNPPVPLDPSHEAVLTVNAEQAKNIADVVDSLRTEVDRLTQKCRRQRLELRRLNASTVDKLHRLEKTQYELRQERVDTAALTATVRAFIEGEIVVVNAAIEPDLNTMMGKTPV